MAQPGGQAPNAKRPLAPKTALGKWAIVLAVVGVGWFVVAPLITMKFRTTYPVTDSWIMPTIGLVLVDLAAVINVLAIKKAKENSVLSIVSMALIVALGLFITLFVVGEGIGSRFGFTD